MPDPQPRPNVTSESLEREFKRLRGAVSEYPELRFLVENMPEETPGPVSGPGAPVEQDADHSEPPRATATEKTTSLGTTVTVVTYPDLLTFSDYDRGTQLAPRPMRREDKVQALNARQEIFRNRASELNAQLKQGRIESDEWLRRMMGQVKDLHTTAYAIGYSGRWDEISSQDWGAVGATVQRQYRYLRRWRQQILQRGLDDFSLAQLNARAQMYGAAASESFEKGYGAEVGLPPGVLPAVPGDGSTSCRSHCKCRWAINILDKRSQDFDCTWTLGVAEHCRECLERADAWVQLEVRNGILVSDYPQIFAR